MNCKTFSLICFIRKSSRDDEVIATAKSLIKTWKKFVPESQEKKERKKEEKSDEQKKNEAQAKELAGKSFPARWDMTAYPWHVLKIKHSFLLDPKQPQMKFDYDAEKCCARL